MRPPPLLHYFVTVLCTTCNVILGCLLINLPILIVGGGLVSILMNEMLYFTSNTRTWSQENKKIILNDSSPTIRYGEHKSTPTVAKFMYLKIMRFF